MTANIFFGVSGEKIKEGDYVGESCVKDSVSYYLNGGKK